MLAIMKVGVYVDAYNLYYGGLSCCGRSKPGWRWIDIRALIENVIATQGSWQSSTISRIVYCTARVSAVVNPSAHADQDVYLKALIASGSVDWIEYGNYVARAKTAFLATENPKTHKPSIFTSAWPVMVKDSSHQIVPDARFMVKYMHMEEKGSDVNVASHLLSDVLLGEVDAAVVVSNDSDLTFPVRTVRKKVPVGLVNPRAKFTAGSLMGQHSDGVGGHWWWNLQKAAYHSHQLPNTIGKITKPVGW